MKFYRQISANELLLSPFPFKRELSMEAYLVENAKVLELDNQIFTDVEIIDDEISLKLGRKRKGTDGRIDLLVQFAKETLGVVELKLGELSQQSLEQLEDYLEYPEKILNKISDIVEDGSEQKWVGILAGTSIEDSLKKKIQDGYRTKNNIPIAALTIQRYRSEDGQIFVLTDTIFPSSKSTKDYTKYEFENRAYSKSRLVLMVLKRIVEDKPEELTYAELRKIFPDRLQGSLNVIAPVAEAQEIEERTGHRRHYLNSDQIIQLADMKVAVCNQWGSRNIEKFASVARKMGYEVKKVDS